MASSQQSPPERYWVFEGFPPTPTTSEPKWNHDTWTVHFELLHTEMLTLMSLMKFVVTDINLHCSVNNWGSDVSKHYGLHDYSGEGGEASFAEWVEYLLDSCQMIITCVKENVTETSKNGPILEHIEHMFNNSLRLAFTTLSKIKYSKKK